MEIPPLREGWSGCAMREVRVEIPPLREGWSGCAMREGGGDTTTKGGVVRLCHEGGGVEIPPLREGWSGLCHEGGGWRYHH